MNSAQLRALIGINFRICFNEILSNRVRTFITTLGIFLGITALLVNMAFIRGMDDDLRRSMEQIGNLSIITIHAKPARTPQEKIQYQNSPGLRMSDATALARALPYIDEVIRFKEMGGEALVSKGKFSFAHITAVSPEYLRNFNYATQSGRMISSEDNDRITYACMMGQMVAQRLFGITGDPVGKSLTIQKKPYTVIGIIQTANNRDRRAFECLIPYSVYEKEKGGADKTEQSLSLKLSASNLVQRAKLDIPHQLQALHRGVMDFEIEASADKIKDMEVASSGLKVILWVIAIISLSVGGISIANIMFATIGNRIREIGIRKALGARQADIFLQFIIESVTICFVGGIPGFFMGSVVTMMPTGFFPYEPRLESFDFLLACGSIVFIGLFSGLFPALKAARMQPVDALRQ